MHYDGALQAGELLSSYRWPLHVEGQRRAAHRLAGTVDQLHRHHMGTAVDICKGVADLITAIHCGPVNLVLEMLTGSQRRAQTHRDRD